MKPILLTCSILFLALTFWTCRTDDDPVVEQESPFFDLLEQPAINIDTTPTAASVWEYGFVFRTIKAGKINHVGVKLPTTGNFIVRLWNLSGPTPVLLREREVQVPVQHQASFMPIQPVTVPAGVTFGISIVANSFYRIEKKDGSSFTFPRTIGNFEVLSFREAMNDLGATTFPPTQNDKRVAPCVNVVFVAD